MKKMQRIRSFEQKKYKQALGEGKLHQLLKRILMRTVLLVLLVSAAIAQFSAPNYQERQVFYNEDENVCDQRGNQWINLAIYADGELTKEVVVKTHTICDHWGINDAEKIGVLPRWSYLDDTNELIFEEEVTPFFYRNEVVGIVTKTTVISPATIEGKQYNCIILGNGEVLHYGGDSSLKYEPPTISIRCATPEQVQ